MAADGRKRKKHGKSERQDEGRRRNGDENGEKKVAQDKWCDVRGSRITREKEIREKKMTRWRLSAEETSNNL